MPVTEKQQQRADQSLARAMDSHRAGNYAEAELSYKAVFFYRPDDKKATVLLRLCQRHRQSEREQGKSEALTALHTGDLEYGLGNVLDAYDCYNRAISANDQFGQAHTNLAVLCTEILRHDESWRSIKVACNLDRFNPSFNSAAVFISDLADGVDGFDTLATREVYNVRLIRSLLSEAKPHTPDTRPRKLRIGYVSDDFFEHSAATTFGNLIVHHDRDQFEVTLYSGTQNPDQVTEGFKRNAERYRDIRRKTEQEIADLIRADGIDILVDLSGYSLGSRLLVYGRKPAPIQVSGWGYATGTGLDCFDWFFTDTTAFPPGTPWVETEKPWYLPCALSWMPPTHYEVAKQPLKERAYKDDYSPVLGSLNRQQKITQTAIALWSDILKASPDVRLLVKNPRLDHPQFQQVMADAFEKKGISRGGRGAVNLFGGGSHGAYLASYGLVDLVLDTTPHTGGVTTFEALWMGVPVLTLKGTTIPSRISASILKQMGLSDFICSTPEEYQEKARAFAENPGRYGMTRNDLRKQLLASPAVNGRVYCRLVEDAYREMYQSLMQKGVSP